jgi:hypothetical protein
MIPSLAMRSTVDMHNDQFVYGVSFSYGRHKYNPMRLLFGDVKRLDPLRVFIVKVEKAKK